MGVEVMAAAAAAADVTVAAAADVTVAAVEAGVW